MNLKNFTWGRAKKFYFALLAALTALVQGNYIEGGLLKFVMATIAVLFAMSTWLFSNDPPVDSTKYPGMHVEA